MKIRDVHRFWRKLLMRRKMELADVAPPILCEGDASQMSAVSWTRQEGK